MTRKQALGKGLNALIADSARNTRDASLGEADVLPLNKLKPNPKQPRQTFDKTELEALANSIKQHGVIQPILVRPQGSHYEIIAGERRYTASKQAGLKEIPAYVREVSDKEAQSYALVENLQRVDLNPLEEAQAYTLLMEENNLTQAELARLVSKSRPVIANSVRLLDLATPVKQYIKQDKLSSGHARLLLQIRDQQQQIAYARRIVSEGLSVRETEELVSSNSLDTKPIKAHNKAQRAKPSQRDVYEQYADSLAKQLKRDVTIRKTQKNKYIQIAFQDEKDLKRLMKQLNA